MIDGTGARGAQRRCGCGQRQDRRGGRDLGSQDGARSTAAGAIVTPGFVDIHTHYDGQATWASRMSPSNHHGVTTVVMGNCGVGFAPVKRTDHDLLIELMEGVEDIPGAACTKVCRGIGRRSRSISTICRSAVSTWTSRRSCRTRRCAST